MECSAMKPRLWQWYAHSCGGDVFQIVGYDTSSGRIRLKYFNGDLRSIQENVWSALALELRDPPEDWTDAACEIPCASDSLEQDRHSNARMQPLQESPSKRQPRVRLNEGFRGQLRLAHRKSA